MGDLAFPRHCVPPFFHPSVAVSTNFPALFAVFLGWVVEGLLVKRMVAHSGSEDHQWEGCKGLADLAARDSDGQSAVRRQGGTQVGVAGVLE